MSEQIGTIADTGGKGRELQLTEFSGGQINGQMIQLTQGFGHERDEPGFIQLTTWDARLLIGRLTDWLNSRPAGG